MGFLRSVFGTKKSYSTVLLESRNRIFDLYGVTHPTDAQHIKASFYLCIAGVAIINDATRGQLRGLIDKLVEQSKKSTSLLQAKVGDLANNEEELAKIISDFPAELKVKGSTLTNGLAGFEAMYFSIGVDMIPDILNHSGGVTGVPGYAAIVVGYGIFGEDDDRANHAVLGMELMRFAKEFSEAK